MPRPVLPVVEGHPEEENFEVVARGEAFLAGRTIEGDTPGARCACGAVSHVEPWGEENRDVD